MITKTELVEAIKELPERGKGLANNEIVALLLLIGYEFPRIQSVEELSALPLGTMVFDKDFKLVVAKRASEGRPDNDNETFVNRSPLHVLCVPDPN